MTKSKDKPQCLPTSPISFPRWREVLQNEQLDPILTRSHEGEIFAYLKYLKTIRCRASVESVQEYLLSLEEQGKKTDSAVWPCVGFLRQQHSSVWAR